MGAGAMTKSCDDAGTSEVQPFEVFTGGQAAGLAPDGEGVDRRGELFGCGDRLRCGPQARARLIAVVHLATRVAQEVGGSGLGHAEGSATGLFIRPGCDRSDPPNPGTKHVRAPTVCQGRQGARRVRDRKKGRLPFHGRSAHTKTP